MAGLWRGVYVGHKTHIGFLKKNRHFLRKMFKKNLVADFYAKLSNTSLHSDTFYTFLKKEF